MNILSSVGSLTIRNVEFINIPALQHVTLGDMNLADNTITTLSVPKLESVIGSLGITNNTYLFSTDISSLISVGAVGTTSNNLTFAQNPSLNQMSNYRKFSLVYGNISLSGPLWRYVPLRSILVRTANIKHSVSFPQMKSFKKDFSLKSTSTSPTLDCSYFDQIENSSSGNSYIYMPSIESQRPCRPCHP